MNDKLYRLVYLSRNQIPGDHEAVKSEIRQILEVARAANLAEHVTGALMFNSGCFAQVLEGPHDRVQTIFERIQCDERHSDVIILDFSPVHERSFPVWSMAYVGVEASSIEEFATIAADTGFEPNRISGDRILAVLRDRLDEAETLSRLNNAA